MGMITLTGTLTAKNAAEAEMVRQFFPEHIRLSRAEPGCLKFEVTPGADPLVWHLDEAFINAAAFEAHQSRTRASVWFEKSAPLARDFHKTEV